MTETRSLSHAALEDAGGVALEHARLTDQQRLGVVLQGAALLSHFEHGGWFLPSGWSEARSTPQGLLTVGAIQAGHSGQLVQVSLRDLLKRLFNIDDAIGGRGTARSGARYLMKRWQQVLAPVSGDRAVAEIFEVAPFLWLAGFGEARKRLVAEHHGDRESHLWIAGPGSVRLRFFDKARELSEVESLLSGDQARDLWEGWRAGADPNELTDKGQWRQAVAAWRREPPRNSKEALAYARCLYALGRYEQMLEVLKRRRQVGARLLRARAQFHLGELGAAQTTIRGLAEASLSDAQLLELTDVAIRLLGARGQHDEIRHWVARSLARTRGQARIEAAILAVGAGWDCGDLATMDRYLEESRCASDDPVLAGRWHHMKGLRSIHVKDGPGAVEHVSIALRLDRRRVLRAEAGRLWNDLALGRALVDDLPGAERACQHALRLLRDCDGPSPITLALYNLAEVRLRRGHTEGVESTLERSTAENRRSGNLRGLLLDLELWVRLELAQGRAAAAVARCTEALMQLDHMGANERRGIFELFAARGNGWLGRRDRARACLTRAGSEVVLELEPEERPAVWAHAGNFDKALEEASQTRWANLWTALATKAYPPSEIWEALASLEPFRAARLIFDCELILPGVTPPYQIRRAIATLRACGSEASAERLENGALSPWRALTSYLAGASFDKKAAAELLRDAGYDEVRLTWTGGGEETVLFSGSGGDQKLSAPLEGGRLELAAPVIDATLKALFAILGRDLRPLAESKSVKRRVVRDGLVGESPGLLLARGRLDQLAKEDLPILILGESGTGKELMAQRAHRMSPRSEGHFLPVNCAELSESLTQSDLFGHVKGSFTGADRNRPGVFESALSGTVFLDEIGDLPLATQGKLLRVLQEGEIRRIGESFARKINVRVIAATHRDLEEMVNLETFRQDLFFRLKVATVKLPPLRDRGNDVLLLADHFLSLKRSDCHLTDAARKRLLSYHWPGNVRELQNVLSVAMALAPKGEISDDQLDLPKKTAVLKSDYHESIDRHRRKLLLEALTATGGNQAAAARRLGLTRQALSYLVKQLDLS